MKIIKLAVVVLSATSFLSGCSNAVAERQAKIQITTADRQAQIDKAITEGCRDFNTKDYAAAVIPFGSAARLDPRYLEVARAAEFYAIAKDATTSLTIEALKAQLVSDLVLVGGFCAGA